MRLKIIVRRYRFDKDIPVAVQVSIRLKCAPQLREWRAMVLNDGRWRVAICSLLIVVGASLIYRAYRLEARASYEVQQASFDR